MAMLTIEIDNRDGMMWDISGIVSEATWKTTRVGQPASFDFTLIRGGIYEYDAFKYNVGDIVRVRYGEANVFYGYIFTIDAGRDEQVKMTAFDQIRYLLANDTYIFKEMTATKIIQQIAGDFKLKTGELDDTVHVIPQRTEDNKKLLDMICKALDLTLMATTKTYVFFDDFGTLQLKELSKMKLDLVLGDQSLLYDYKNKRSIENAANRIKIMQSGQDKTQPRKVYYNNDEVNESKWGILQHFQTVDEKQNEEQINQLLDNLLKLKNRVQQSFQVDALGDIRVRAGSGVYMYITELAVDKYFIVNTCTHKFEGLSHTMSLELGGVLGDGITGDY